MKEEFETVNGALIYLVVPHKQGVVCLVCQIMIAVMKEYDAKRHYKAKHASQFLQNSWSGTSGQN